MARLTKRGNIYWASGYDRHGQRWRRSTKQRDRIAAQAVAAQIERELALDADQPRDEACTLAVALSLTIRHATKASRAEGTIEFLTTKARHLVRLIGDKKRCSRIELSDTMSYYHKRLDEGASPHTVSHELRVLVQALRRASKLGLYRPLIDPGMLKPDELRGAYVPRERWLPVPEYQALLVALDPERTKHSRSEDRRDYVIMWCSTGLRESELYGLEPRDVDFASGVLHVRGTKTAKAKRTIPLTPTALEVLERRKGKVPMFPRWTTCQRDLMLACLRIEAALNPTLEGPERNAMGRVVGGKRNRVRPANAFDPVSPNDLRRTFASWLAQAGVPLHHAAKLMGHGSTAMLERVYARLAPETLRAAVAMLPSSVSGAEGAQVVPMVKRGKGKRK